MSALPDRVSDFITNLPKDLVEQAEKNHQEHLKKQRAYMAAYPKEKKLKHWRNRNERVKKASEGLSAEEKKKLKHFYGMCPLGMEVDHIVPICKGGKHCVENLQYLTRQENYRKGSGLGKRG